jgi:putative transposase
LTEGIGKVTRVIREVQVGAGGVCDLGYHVVWYLKYRPPVRAGQTATGSEELVWARADGRGWRVVALEITARHVHLSVNTHPSPSASRIANQFRGFITPWLCAEFAHLNGRPRWKERSR